MTLGKIVSGGMPGAAGAGREDVLAVLDFRRAEAHGLEKVFHMGTHNAAPASCAAGIAALRWKLRLGLLVHGVDVQGWPGGPVSAAHTEADREGTVIAFRNTIQALREEGHL